MSSHVRLAGVLALFGTVVLLGGCGPNVERKDQVDLVYKNYKAVDNLLCTARVCLPRDTRILTATFVDLDNYNSSSSLGRILGQACASRLTQRGYNVVNMNLRRDAVVIIPNSGEFMLSRDMKDLSKDYAAEAVLVGTYKRTHVTDHIITVTKKIEDADSNLELVKWPRKFQIVDDYLYVSLRLIRSSDNSVIAAYDYRVVCDDGIESLSLEAEPG
jgi:hypothetical protein